MLFEQAHMIHGAFDHRLGYRRAVFGKDMLFQAAAVHADADGDAPRPAGGHHLFHPLLRADVAGVDADLVRPGVERRQRGLVVKVDIGHDRDIDRFLDGGDDSGVGRGGYRDAHDLAAGFGHTPGLFDIARDILHGHIEHGLHGDRLVAADRNIADPDRPFALTLHS